MLIMEMFAEDVGSNQIKIDALCNISPRHLMLMRRLARLHNVKGLAFDNNERCWVADSAASLGPFVKDAAYITSAAGKGIAIHEAPMSKSIPGKKDSNLNRGVDKLVAKIRERQAARDNGQKIPAEDIQVAIVASDYPDQVSYGNFIRIGETGLFHIKLNGGPLKGWANGDTIAVRPNEVFVPWDSSLQGKTTVHKEFKGITEGVYTASDFKVDAFESMSAFRRWVRSPKTNTRGMTRFISERYENIFINPTLLFESTEQFAKRKQEAKSFSSNFKQLDQRDQVQIKVGNSIAVLSSTVIPDDTISRIEMSGFVNPKKIVKIHLNSDEKIDSLEFQDGSIFPESSEFTTIGGSNITNTIFFSDYASAAKAHTAIWMYLGKLEGSGWKVERFMSEVSRKNLNKENIL